MKVNISVTKNDLAVGTRHDCENCPVARAVSRRVKKGVKVEARQFNVWLNDTMIETPCQVGYNMAAFDFMVIIPPFKFELDIPKRYLA